MIQFRLKITPEMYFLVSLFLNQSRTKMFYRTILTKLEAWAEKKDRKPLILRGARQVGKTTLVELFSMEYDTYLYLNLELQADKDVFGWVPSLKFLFLNMHTKSF
jgi:predicted AAA+ superfamily ATPase